MFIFRENCIINFFLFLFGTIKIILDKSFQLNMVLKILIIKKLLSKILNFSWCIFEVYVKLKSCTVITYQLL